MESYFTAHLQFAPCKNRLKDKSRAEIMIIFMIDYFCRLGSRSVNHSLPKVTNGSSCPTSSPKLKDILFPSKDDEENYQILTCEKLEPLTFCYFCLKDYQLIDF